LPATSRSSASVSDPRLRKEIGIEIARIEDVACLANEERAFADEIAHANVPQVFLRRHHLLRLQEARRIAPHIGDEDEAAGFLGERRHIVDLTERQAGGFFEEDVFAGLQREVEIVAVRLVGRQDEDGVDIR
jgi:hypothetical protein